MHRCLMMMPLLLFPVLAAYGADLTCPWLNAATAEGFLEGPVDVAVTKDGANGTCDFTRRGAVARLHIEVVISATALAANKMRCTNPVVDLKAIGNEAVACGIDATTQQVAGRVRTQAFLIRISGAFPPDILRRKATNIAEQVAGSLF